MEYLLLVIGAILVNNFVLSRFLGICPFLGVSKKIGTAMGMSGAVVFVITAAAAVTWCLQAFVLKPSGLEYLQTIAFILVIAAFVQFLDTVMKKYMPPLHAALGIFLPLITTNCAVLGVAVLNAKAGSSSIHANADKGFVESVLFAFAASVGFAFALLIFTGLREKIERADPPRAFKGVAIALITGGLLSLAFMGFSGLVK